VKRMLRSYQLAHGIFQTHASDQLVDGQMGSTADDRYGRMARPHGPRGFSSELKPLINDLTVREDTVAVMRPA
jgi:hypothetical protein